MLTNGSLSLERMLDATVRIPHHVVLRAFPKETVVLHLEAGKYLSLNPAGGHFLEVLEQAGSFREGLAQLQGEFPDQDPVAVRTDLYEFCVDLVARGLIEVVEVQVAPSP